MDYKHPRLIPICFLKGFLTTATRLLLLSFFLVFLWSDQRPSTSKPFFPLTSKPPDSYWDSFWSYLNIWGDIHYFYISSGWVLRIACIKSRKQKLEKFAKFAPDKVKCFLFSAWYTLLRKHTTSLWLHYWLSSTSCHANLCFVYVRPEKR